MGPESCSGASCPVSDQSALSLNLPGSRRPWVHPDLGHVARGPWTGLHESVHLHRVHLLSFRTSLWRMLLMPHPYPFGLSLLFQGILALHRAACTRVWVGTFSGHWSGSAPKPEWQVRCAQEVMLPGEQLSADSYRNWHLNTPGPLPSGGTAPGHPGHWLQGSPAELSSGRSLRNAHWLPLPPLHIPTRNRCFWGLPPTCF